MKTKFLIFGAIATLATTTASAQAQIGGRLMGMSDFTVTDMMQLSQQQYIFSSARSAAMSGAFTSLGADISSMSINPAGLGMYRSTEFTLSPAVLSSKMNSSYGAPYQQGDINRTRFSLNNVGFTLNLYQGSGAITSATFGFSYNRLADFNSQSRIGFGGESFSISDVFAQQMRGINYSQLQSDSYPYDNYDIYPNEWGGVLAYQTYLIDTLAGSNNLYGSGVLGDGVTVNPYLRSIRQGRIGEYDISGGINIKNKLYLGLTIGIQDIYYQERLEYDESYNNNPLDLNYMLYDQSLIMSGTGVNFKFGAIYRPIPALRIGLAVHTPTFVSVTRTYNASMNTNLQEATGAVNISAYTNDLVFDYNFNTPTRLLTGISYTFGTTAIISADYERAWYNGMRLRKADASLRDLFKQDAKNLFRATNNVRIGLEIKPTQRFALRAGYGYYDTGVNKTLEKEGIMFNGPVALDSYNISGGLGYRFTPSVSLDFAYVYMRTNYSNYDLFYYDGPDNAGNSIVLGQPYSITTKQDRHVMTMTLGLRF